MTLRHKFLPYIAVSCLEFLKIVEKEGKFFITDCKNKHHCLGCEMCQEGIVLDFDPRKVINRKEISEYDDDRFVDYSRGIIALNPEVIQKRLKPYKESKDLWYYYTDIIADSDTLVVFQLAE